MEKSNLKNAVDLLEENGFRVKAAVEKKDETDVVYKNGIAESKRVILLKVLPNNP